MENKNLWLIHTKQNPIKGQLILRHIWKGTSNECRSLWRFNEDVVIDGVRQYTTLNGSFRDIYTSFKAQYLYVTSKDPYEKGDWVKNITIEAEPPFKLDVHGIRYTQLAPCKFEKIVLTTDDYLIQDGIHSVEDDFLDWFCKNSTCQNVEFTKNYLSNDGQWKEVLLPSEWEVDTKVGYKIIIPKEEPNYNMKQEIIAEMERLKKEEPISKVAERILANNIDGLREALNDDDLFFFYKGVIINYGEEMIKWQQENTNINALDFEIDYLKKEIKVLKHQQERMYNEEELLSILQKYRFDFSLYKNIQVLPLEFSIWFKQFKKK